MGNRRPRVVLNITPRLLQDTLTVALAPHADVVDLMELRERRQGAEHIPAFDLAVVSGGSLPAAVAADVVIDIDGGDGIPSLESIHDCLRGIGAGE